MVDGTNLPAARAEAHAYYFHCELYSIYSRLKSIGPLINSYIFLPALQATGNFPTVTRVLLSKIPPVDGRMTYVYDEYVVRNQTAYYFFIPNIYIYFLFSLPPALISFNKQVSLRCRRGGMLPLHVRRTQQTSHPICLPPGDQRPLSFQIRVGDPPTCHRLQSQRGIFEGDSGPHGLLQQRR